MREQLGSYQDPGNTVLLIKKGNTEQQMEISVPAACKGMSSPVTEPNHLGKKKIKK